MYDKKVNTWLYHLVHSNHMGIGPDGTEISTLELLVTSVQIKYVLMD